MSQTRTSWGFKANNKKEITAENIRIKKYIEKKSEAKKLNSHL